MKPIDEFIPHSVSIYKLCEINNSLELHTQIVDRIIKELEENESMGNYVRINLNSEILDFTLDDDGMFILSDLLMEYFDEKEIIDLWKYLRDLNKYNRNEYEFEQIFKSLSVRQIKEMIIKYLAYEPKPEQIEGKHMVIDRLKQELKERKNLKKTF